MADSLSEVTQLSGSESSPAAYAQLLPTIMAQDDERVVNVDVMFVVTLILGSLPTVRTLQPQLARLPDFDITLLDRIDDMVRALQHSHGLYLQATKSPVALQALIDRATDLREVFHADAIALAKRGVLNPDSFREVKRNNGHRALVVDLQILVQTLREKLPAIQGKSHVTAQELDEAVLLVDTLTQAIGTKEHSPQVREQTVTIRAKALRMVTNAWDEIRSATAWVRRREGDAERFAPSIYSNRASSKPAAEEADPNAATGVHPVASAEPGATPDANPTTNLSAELAQKSFKRSSEG